MLISEISDGKHLRRWGTELLDAESIQAQAMVSDDQPWSANMGPTLVKSHQIVMFLDMFLLKHYALKGFSICKIDRV